MLSPSVLQRVIASKVNCRVLSMDLRGHGEDISIIKYSLVVKITLEDDELDYSI